MENDGHKDFGQQQRDNSCRVVLSNIKKEFIGHNRAVQALDSSIYAFNVGTQKKICGSKNRVNRGYFVLLNGRNI